MYENLTKCANFTVQDIWRKISSRFFEGGDKCPLHLCLVGLYAYEYVGICQTEQGEVCVLGRWMPPVTVSQPQGRSDGGVYRVGLYIPPKSVQVNFLWGKMT